MIFHPVEETVSPRVSGGVPSHLQLLPDSPTLLSTYWSWHLKCFTLPDCIADPVGVSGADAAEHGTHCRVLWNFPFVKRWQEDGRLVHILHNDLECRPVREIVQTQETGVNVIVDGLCSHDIASLCFIVQRLRKERTFIRLTFLRSLWQAEKKEGKCISNEN